MSASKVVRVTAAVIAIALILTLSAFISPAAQAASSKEGIINDNNVNLREKPSTASSVIIKMTQSSQVSILSQSGGWYKIKYKNKYTGYVREDFVDVKKTGLNDPAIMTDDGTLYKDSNDKSAKIESLKKDTEVTIIGSYGNWIEIKHGLKSGYIYSKLVHKYTITTLNVTGSVNASDVKLRKSPNTAASVLTVLKKSTALTVYQLKDNWLYVSAGGKKGYVRSDYVTYKTPAGTSYKTLKLGMKGQLVTDLQNALKKKGLFSAKVNGSYGNETKEAVVKFQQSMKLKDDGTAGAQTLLLLYGPQKAAGKTNTPSSNTVASQPPQTNGKVEMVDWFGYAENQVKKYVVYEVIDVRTGIKWNMRRFGGWWHADVETVTTADTEAMTKAWGGTLSGTRRPVWVLIDGKYLAASLMGYVHGTQTIKDNGMDGQVCLHFRGSKIQESGKVDARHQACIVEAFNSAGKLDEYIKEGLIP